MIKRKQYFIIFGLIVLFDRVSKYMIYHYLNSEYVVNPFLSFNLTFNRGMAWGIFNTGNASTFLSVSALVIVVYALLTGFTVYRLQKNYSIIAETFILSGGISNIVDRFIYHGVIDFIIFNLGSWSWPAFNIADASIVIGVLFLGVACIQE